MAIAECGVVEMNFFWFGSFRDLQQHRAIIAENAASDFDSDSTSGT